MKAGNVFLSLVALDGEGAYIDHVAETHGHDDTGENWFRLRVKMKIPAGTKYVDVQFAWDGSGEASAQEAHGIVRIDDLECAAVPES